MKRQRQVIVELIHRIGQMTTVELADHIESMIEHARRAGHKAGYELGIADAGAHLQPQNDTILEHALKDKSGGNP